MDSSTAVPRADSKDDRDEIIDRLTAAEAERDRLTAELAVEVSEHYATKATCDRLQQENDKLRGKL